MKQVYREHAEMESQQLKAQENVKSQNKAYAEVKVKTEPEEPILNGGEVQIKIEQVDEIKREILEPEEINVTHPLAAIQVADR